jgi:hypothetical protein
MGMWANKACFVGLAGTFLLAATALPPNWVWLARSLQLAAGIFALLALFVRSQRRAPIRRSAHAAHVVHVLERLESWTR